VNDPWLVYLALASLFALTCGVLVLAWTRGRLGVASASVFLLALATWVVAFAAVLSGFRDADGFVDCRDACTGVHLAAALGFIAPPLLVSVAAAGMIVVLVRRRRGAHRG